MKKIIGILLALALAAGLFLLLPERAETAGFSGAGAVYGRTLIFDSTFSVRYLLKKDVFDAALAAGATVDSFTVTANGKTRNVAGVIGSDQVITIDDVAYYWVKVDGIAAKDIETEIEFSFVGSRNGEIYTDTYTDSVAAALTQAAGDHAGIPFGKAANATLAYCKAAADAFGKPNAITFADLPAASGYSPLHSNFEGSGAIRICGTSLLLKDELAIKFWAEKGDWAGSPDDLTVKINGETVGAEKAANGKYFTFKTSVPVDQAKTAMTVELFANGASVSNRYTDSVLNYAVTLAEEDDSLGLTIVNYVHYVNAYFDSLLPQTPPVDPTEDELTPLIRDPAGIEYGPLRSVQAPMTERPCYALTANATPDEIRAMVVKAMRDELSIVWYPERDAEYTFTSTVTGQKKDFQLYTATNYAGLPYTNAITGLMQFWEYYDPATGRVRIPYDTDHTLGNQCAGSIIWAWQSCVSSVKFKSIATRGTKGVLQLGDFTYTTGTMATCETNGAQVMYEAYALVKPADLLVSGTPGDNHVIMAILDAHVERSGGVIDGKKSYIMIQDQRGGQRSNTSTYVITENGETHHYAGRLSAKYTFESLFTRGYLPYTCAEFQGLKSYTLPGVQADRSITSFDTLNAATLSSNYALCAFHITVRDAGGAEVYTRSHITNYTDMRNGRLTAYPLSGLQLTRSVLSGKATGSVTVEIRCVDATGSEFQVASFTASV